MHKVPSEKKYQTNQNHTCSKEFENIYQVSINTRDEAVE
jgi:hypothetical protein